MAVDEHVAPSSCRSARLALAGRRAPPAFAVEGRRHVVGHRVDDELSVMRLAHDAQRRPHEGAPMTPGSSCAVPARRVRISGRPSVERARCRGRTPPDCRCPGEKRMNVRDVAHGCHDVAFDQPGVQEVTHHHIDVLLACPRDLRKRERPGECAGRRRFETNPEKASPVLQSRVQRLACRSKSLPARTSEFKRSSVR